MNKNGTHLAWLGVVIGIVSMMTGIGEFWIGLRPLLPDNLEPNNGRISDLPMERSKIERVEEIAPVEPVESPVEQAVIQSLFADDFSQSSLDEMWKVPTATLKPYAWVEDGMMVVSVKPDTAVDLLTYPIIPMMQLAQTNGVARPNHLQFTMAVDTPAHPYRGQLGIKMTCGETGWAKLLVGGNDNTLRLNYALDNGMSDTIPFGTVTTGVRHDIALAWHDAALNITIDGTTYAPVSGFDCGSRASTIQLIAMVEMCGVEEIGGRFDNIQILTQ